MRDVFFSCIVAVAENGVIGRKNGLPWRIKSDLRRFRELTMGHPLIMGGNTFRSIGKPLDGRDSIVVTNRAADFAGAKVLTAASFREAMEIGKKKARERGVEEVFVIGGVAIFELAMPVCKRIYLTLVHGSPEGDVIWKIPSGRLWKEVSRTSREKLPEDEFAVTDVILERRTETTPQNA